MKTWLVIWKWHTLHQHIQSQSWELHLPRNCRSSWWCWGGPAWREWTPVKGKCRTVISIKLQKELTINTTNLYDSCTPVHWQSSKLSPRSAPAVALLRSGRACLFPSVWLVSRRLSFCTVPLHHRHLKFNLSMKRRNYINSWTLNYASLMGFFDTGSKLLDSHLVIFIS